MPGKQLMSKLTTIHGLDLLEKVESLSNKHFFFPFENENSLNKKY